MNCNAPLITDSLNTWLNYWGHVHVTGIDLGLERVIPVAEKLGVTRPSAKVLTVAGTNGKGSTTTTLAAILRAQGYNVGLYQSPHVYRFNERVKINGVEVADHLLVEAFVLVDQARRDCGLSLSFFEATSLAAFLIFQQQQCDVWVLEVGLGGRLDVVNVINPDVAVITNIGIDHVEWIGDTIEKIAFEKAGIIRPNIPVVFAGQQQIPQAIQDKVTECHAKLYAVNRDYFFHDAENEQYWNFASAARTLRLPLGHLALDNIAAAVAAIHVSGLEVSLQALTVGIENARLAGRFDVRKIAGKTVIFDAGHNPHGVEFLLRNLQKLMQKQKKFTEILTIFSMLGDKDINSVVKLLKGSTLKWKIAELNVPRAADLAQLSSALNTENNVEQFENIKAAFESALAEVKDNQIILVCGSFHTLEAIWECLEEWQ